MCKAGAFVIVLLAFNPIAAAGAELPLSDSQSGQCVEAEIEGQDGGCGERRYRADG